MESKVNILRTYWSRKAKLLQKPVTSLHLDLATPEQANCKGNHPAWSKSCQKKQEAIQKAREAWLARPGRYTTAPRLALPQTPSTQEKEPSLQDRQEAKKRKQREVLRAWSSSRLNTQLPTFPLAQNSEFQINIPRKKATEILEDSSQED